MNRLKELRKEKKLTQEELAGEIGVSKITILRWENGERQIKPDKAQKLADHFGVSIGYLLGYPIDKNHNLLDSFIDLTLELSRSIRKIDNKELTLYLKTAQSIVEGCAKEQARREYREIVIKKYPELENEI